MSTDKPTHAEQSHAPQRTGSTLHAPAAHAPAKKPDEPKPAAKPVESAADASLKAAAAKVFPKSTITVETTAAGRKLRVVTPTTDARLPERRVAASVPVDATPEAMQAILATLAEDDKRQGDQIKRDYPV